MTTYLVNGTTAENPDQDTIDRIDKAVLNTQRYGYLAIVPIGLIGNTLSFLVMMQKQNRAIPSNLYIAFLAISDNILLVDKMALSKAYFYGSQYMDKNCKFLIFLGGMSMISSAYLIVLLTVDRYIAVVHPFKVITDE